MKKLRGIGVDIESIETVKNSCKNEKFISLIFTKNEIKYCKKKKDPYISFAGKFCAKEAVFKAINRDLDLKDIEINNKETGNIEVSIKGKINKKIHCSVSHTTPYAISFVVIEE